MDEMTDSYCPIWQTAANALPTTRDGQDVDSPRAGGRYFISGTASAMLKNWDEPEKVLLTSWLVEQRRLGVSCPKVLSATLEEVAKRRPMSVHDRADSLLRYLGSTSDLLGTVVKFYAEDNAKASEEANMLMAWTASRRISEVITLAEYADAEGWIAHRVTQRAGASNNDVHELMLRPPGYSRLAVLVGASSVSSQAFVAMWFDPSLIDAYNNGIAPAIRDAGYEPLRIDQKDHNNKIDDEIIAEIRRSRFVIADFTQGASGARGGVYFEAGFAHGVNIPVIFTCRADALKDVHFDTRQYNHLAWNDIDELRSLLARRISATIGDGPRKKG